MAGNVDHHNRQITYLRVSVSDRCNLRCMYCVPAERYRFESAEGEIGFISGLSHHSCPACNRLRLTADGKLRPCLFADDEVDIKTPLRDGCSQEDLKTLFQEAIARKPRQHPAKIRGKGAGRRPMSAIGG